jgi:acetyl-CoA C-acetyltransferase
MRDVSIIGIGQTKVAEHWDRSLRHLAGDAVLAAMGDAGIETADALYVGNMMSGLLTGQEHLGALVADFVGLRGIEAVKVEAACGSGAAALRMGYGRGIARHCHRQRRGKDDRHGECRDDDRPGDGCRRRL